MKRIHKKLNSRRGATILFAILVFMLCILAGTAALTAAASNIGRYAHAERDQQQYLSVSSAAGLLRDEFGDAEFEAEISLKEVYTWWYVPNVNGTGPKLVSTTKYELTAPTYTWSGDHELTKALLEDYLEDMFKYYEVPADWYGLQNSSTGGVDVPDGDGTGTRPTNEPAFTPQTLGISGSSEELKKQLLGEVNAAVSVKSGEYAINTALSLKLANDDDEISVYKSSLYLPAETSSHISSTTSTTSTGTDSGQRTTITTLTFTVKWQNGTVTVQSAGGEGT